MIDRIPFGAKPASSSHKYLERSFCPLCRIHYTVETNIWGDVLEDDHAKCKQILNQKAYCEKMLRESLHENKGLLINILIGFFWGVWGGILALILLG